jgi:hypothetical protein
VSRFEVQFLHTPVQNLCDVEFVFGRTRDLMNPAKLPELLTRIAEHTQHLSIKAQLVYSPRQRCPLSRAVRTWRLSRLRTGIDELGTVARPRTENADVCNGTNIEGTRFSGSGGIEDDLSRRRRPERDNPLAVCEIPLGSPSPRRISSVESVRTTYVM